MTFWSTLAMMKLDEEFIKNQVERACSEFTEERISQIIQQKLESRVIDYYRDAVNAKFAPAGISSACLSDGEKFIKDKIDKKIEEMIQSPDFDNMINAAVEAYVSVVDFESTIKRVFDLSLHQTLNYHVSSKVHAILGKEEK